MQQMLTRLMDQDYQDAVARAAETVLQDRVPEIEDPHIIFHREWRHDTTRTKLIDAVRNSNLSADQ